MDEIASSMQRNKKKTFFCKKVQKGDARKILILKAKTLDVLVYLCTCIYLYIAHNV